VNPLLCGLLLFILCSDW